MCGIAGFTHLHSQPDARWLDAARDSILPRGPDQQGVYRGAAASLAAVRLKILDLEGGDQPQVSPDGATVIVFNGEIYNFRELRQELVARGHSFTSHGDTEVVLKAFLEWDTAAFARLHGMFAVALWNEQRRRLVLARDRMGIKPLYVARRGADLHFGSEVKAILAHPGIERRVDQTALSHFLSLNYLPHPHTMLEGVRKLAPASWLEWEAGRERTERYWRVEFQPDARMTLDDARIELDFLLDRAVREHLLSDVPLGVWLSGGLDSSTITHYAAQHFPGRLRTFSVSFAGRRFDESPYFREVARAYGTQHEELDLAPDLDLPGAIERMAHFSDEPSADAGALPVWFLAQMTRRQVTVALSGEGADELFGGYQTYLADAYAAQARRWVPAGVRRAGLAMAQRLLPVSDEKISFEYKVKRFLEGTLLEPAEAHLFWNGVCSREQKRALLGGEGAALAVDAPGEGLNRFLALDQRLYLVEDILYKCDRMSMAHSLEVRPPFLDHRIAEFAARLPEQFKVRGSELKFLLRDLMRSKLPAAVTTRRKEGFDIPAHDWFRTRLKPLLLDTVNERTVRESGLVQWPAVRALMDDHFARRVNAGYHLWGLLTLFLWANRWGPSAANRSARNQTSVSMN
ncbi:MAG: asparagine synthase (glutamine-hydrolyzing) [Bryobacterales bacterium]|nr:asparagine synthase (glutamine-hydrolyzing) [Bryobacterales bacterium]